MQPSLQLIMTGLKDGQAIVSLTVLIKDDDDQYLPQLRLFDARLPRPELTEHSSIESWALDMLTSCSMSVTQHVQQLHNQGQLTLPEDLRKQ